MQKIKAEDKKIAVRGIKGVIFGEHGIGKTSLLMTLDKKCTLFIDIEAGDLCLKEDDGTPWKVDTITPETWPECRALAAWIGGADNSVTGSGTYGAAYCDKAGKEFLDYSLDKYDTIFIDSLSAIGRLCFSWCKTQCLTTTGAVDTRAAYGLHGQEMITWLIRLQKARTKNVWSLGGLDAKLDDLNRPIFAPQIDGSKIGLELPGIVDQVITMAEVEVNGKSYRALVNHKINKWGFPAKDRSRTLNLIEPPHLGNLMDKIRKGKNLNKLSTTLSDKELAEIAASNVSNDEQEEMQELENKEIDFKDMAVKKGLLPSILKGGLANDSK